MKPRLLIGSFVLVAALAACAGNKDHESGTATNSSPTAIYTPQILAQYRGGVITSEDLADAEDFWYALLTSSFQFKHLMPASRQMDLIRMVAAQENLAQRARENGLHETDEFHQWMDTIGRRIATTTYRQKTADTILRQQALAYYRKNAEKYRTPESFEYQNIFIQCDKDDAASYELAEATAQLAFDALKTGHPFDEVERRFSTRAFSDMGQTYEWTPGTTLYPTVEKALRTLKPGEFSRAVEVRHGLMIIRLIEHTPEGYPSFEEVERHCRYKASVESLTLRLEKERARRNVVVNKALLLAPDRRPDDVIVTGTDLLLLASDIKPLEEPITRASQMERERLERIVTHAIEERLLYDIAIEEYSGRPAPWDEPLQKQENAILAALQLDRELSAPMTAIQILDSDIEQEYETNPQRYESELQTRISIINIPSDHQKETEPDKIHFALERSRQICLALLKRIEAGEDFGVLAQEQSTDFNAEHGGALPFAEYGPRGHVIDLAVEQLSPGEISQPVLHENGYFLIRLDEIRKPKQNPLQAVREEIRTMLHWQKRKAVQDAYLDEICQQQQLTLGTESKDSDQDN